MIVFRKVCFLKRRINAWLCEPSVNVMSSCNAIRKLYIKKFNTSPPLPNQSSLFESALSYLLSNNLSTQPPLGYAFPHWLWRWTPKTLFKTWSRPPPSSRPRPIVHLPPLLSGVNGSGKLLSHLQVSPSLKQDGSIRNGGMDAPIRRRQSFKYRSAPQSVEPERGGVEVAII